MGVVAGCGTDAPPTGEAVQNRDSSAVMVTEGVSKLISDSGVVRYKVIAEEWRVYDKTTPSRQEFLKGIYLQRFDEDFRVDLYITADSAYCYGNNLWDLRGRVFINNFASATTFSTSQLYWDMGRHEIWSHHPMHIITPDRDLQGDSFRSNEEMSRYHISRSKGFVPMPRNDTQEETVVEDVEEEDIETDTIETVIRDRQMPQRRTVGGD